jgi:hypothetical protein
VPCEALAGPSSPGTSTRPPGASVIDLDLATRAAEAVLVFGSLAVLAWFVVDLVRGRHRR